MPLPTPNLDDRTFEQLLLEAKARVARSCPEWTDLGAHDPGAVLLEAFAHITETMLYRLNRLPEKAYVEFLRLMGVKLQPPAAARAALAFTLEKPAPGALVIPRGTRVASKRASASGAAAIFTTAQEVRIEKGATAATAVAYHCELVDGELAGRGTGLPGQQVAVQRPPVIARTGDDLDLVVGVEATEAELQAGAPARRHGAKVFRIWREVESFAHAGPDPLVYVADRLAGTVTFAPVVGLLDDQGRLELSPRVHATVPPLGREIRVWYRRGGGPDGNLASGSLEVLKDPLPGLQVTNPEPATGGRSAEPLANALVRGPEEIHSLRRAVTAGDFESLARRSASGIARAHAVTQAEIWTFAPPGTVEVLLVPDLPPEVRGPAERGTTLEALRGHQTELARARIQAELDARRPMGTRCVVSWARLKEVTIKATLLVSRTADPAAIRTRVLDRLHQYVNPLPAGDAPGWAFGEPLARSAVYFILQSEPGVVRVNELRLAVEDVPPAASGLAADFFQARGWYAAEGERLYRSLNDGEGWEVVGRFAGESAERVKPHPLQPGLLAVAARLADPKESRLRLSRDCGETWWASFTLPTINDVAWMVRDGAPVLLVATASGLFEVAAREGASPLPVVVDPANQDRGFWSVAAAMDARGAWLVAAAALEGGGVFLSETAGRSETFEAIGLGGEDVRVLEMQQEGSRTFLWAGITAASGAEQGKGCRVWELTGAGGWRDVDKGWDGGSCRDLAFDGSRVFAATHRAGVLSWDASRADEPWEKPAPSSGLRLREKDKLFQPIAAVAARAGLLLAGGPGGVFRSRDAHSYESCSQADVGRDLLPVPSTWLFCSGAHELDVRTT
ncbi:MAG TPA: putative baseplate assembly protein [Anaeromyxobacter sp.]|nr:putative baseplate assembly protein [Anaeromyxobacter sp.]